MVPVRKELGLIWRKLVRSPGFGVVAVLTLALGIGANTAIFSIVHGVLLTPLPFPEPERLYGMWHRAPGAGFPQIEQSNTTYTVYRNLADSFEQIGLSDGPYSMNLTGTGEPVRVDTAAVTASLFDVLRVSARLGRTFVEEDDDPGAPQVALLSHAFWQSRFGGEPAILGQSIQLNGTAWEVVGVMPEGFTYPGETTSIWIPHVIEPEELGQVNFSYDGLARLKPGVSVEAATAEMNQLLVRIPEIYPGEFTLAMMESAQLAAYLNPLMEDVVGDVSRVLWVLLGTVSFVLLIACANVANLFLVRAEARQRELGLRVALGASRGDLFRHFLVESLMLAALGGVVGLGIAFGALKGLIAMSPESIPRLDEVGIQPAVLSFNTGVSLIAGIVFGLIPVIRYRRPNVTRAINEGSLRTSSGRDTHRARSALVVAQVALALVLLIGSGLMARSFWALRNVDPGFDAENLLTLSLAIPRQDYPTPQDAARFYQSLMDELRTLPGVSFVGAVSSFPMSGNQSNNGVIFEDFPVQEGDLPPVVRTKWATPGFFETLRIPLVEGRPFERRDHEEPTGAAIVSRSVAEAHWPGQSVVGKRLTPGLPREGARWYTIIGVVDDVRDDGLEKAVTPMIYYPVVGFGGEYDDWSIRYMSVSLRTGVPPMSLAPAVRETLWSIDPQLPVVSLRTGEELVARSMARTSYTMLLLAIASGVALFLGSIGIYGVISYIVSQRTREIGVRIALGASRRDVSRMVVRQGVSLAFLGVVLGVVGALFVTRLMASLLYGVSATDFSTFVTVSSFLVALATLASYLPARRAANIEPVRALHYE
ncbi:MAG TPA: ABC transporter permease [Vicinamibacteria bacterium]|nr:ABC transporter permease [Vicinamibacteria bacterium]